MYRNCLKISCFLMITGCASFSKPDVRSDWGALQDAKDLDCRDLPLLPEDLKIERVRVLDSTGPSLFLEVTSRKGVGMFYHLAFRKKSDLTITNLVKLPITQDSRFLGAGIADGKAVFVVHALVKGKPFIQVRDMTNNVLLAEMATKLQVFELGDWAIEGDKLVALVREDKDDEATDDQAYQELTVPLTQAKGLGLVKSRVIGNGARTFADANGKRWTVTLDRGLSSSKRDPRFKLSPWNAALKSSPLELDEKGPIESWRVLETTRGLTMAYIKGDSLLWENTSLEAVNLSLNEPFAKQSGGSYPLSRVHVAQPLIAANTIDTLVLLPQWLDHEITVGVYRFNGTEIAPAGFAGVFKEGTAFEDAFYHSPSESFYLLSRYYSSSIAKYSLCELDQ